MIQCIPKDQYAATPDYLGTVPECHLPTSLPIEPTVVPVVDSTATLQNLARAAAAAAAAASPTQPAGPCGSGSAGWKCCCALGGAAPGTVGARARAECAHPRLVCWVLRRVGFRHGSRGVVQQCAAGRASRAEEGGSADAKPSEGDWNE